MLLILPNGSISVKRSAWMQIDTVYVEDAVRTLPITAEILKRIRAASVQYVQDYQDVFSRSGKDYLSKRLKSTLFIAEKRGALVREAPAAYGFGADDLHYYHIHAYNCIYECEYCYLQGYFRSPDLVFFVNHPDIINAMQEVVDRAPGKTVWFHAGEFSDSLALSHVSQELAHYWEFFAQNPKAALELRTKSTNLTAMRRLRPLPNVVISYSLSTHTQAALHDREAPSVAKRLRAMHRLDGLEFPLGVHFDPIVYSADFSAQFEQLVADLCQVIDLNRLRYLSLGVVRFSKEVYRETRSNYPESTLFARHFIQGSDAKMRYLRPMRQQLLETGKEILKRYGCPEEKIYFCME
jgi:spore photoproduct lyase